MSEIIYKTDRKISRKHTYITIDDNASILVKTNFFTTKEEIDRFIDKKRHWILKHQNRILLAKEHVEKGAYILGKFYPDYPLKGDALDSLYREKSLRIIPSFIDLYSDRMNLFPNKISYRKNRTRWGSCSGKNNLSFNIYLAKTPIDFIEYVVVHELAHIELKNHSKEFWALVKRFLPDYKQRQNLIKNSYYL